MMPYDCVALGSFVNRQKIHGHYFKQRITESFCWSRHTELFERFVDNGMCTYVVSILKNKTKLPMFGQAKLGANVSLTFCIRSTLHHLINYIPQAYARFRISRWSVTTSTQRDHTLDWNIRP